MPLRVHVFASVAPSVKLSIATPDGSASAESTKKALLNRLSGAASALTWRRTPELSMPQASICHTDAVGSRFALYEYEPALPSVFVVTGNDAPGVDPTSLTASFTAASASCRALAESPDRREVLRPRWTSAVLATISPVATMITI